jgi:hypothetical protein
MAFCRVLQSAALPKARPVYKPDCHNEKGYCQNKECGSDPEPIYALLGCLGPSNAGVAIIRPILVKFWNAALELSNRAKLQNNLYGI